MTNCQQNHLPHKTFSPSGYISPDEAQQEDVQLQLIPFRSKHIGLLLGQQQQHRAVVIS